MKETFDCFISGGFSTGIDLKRAFGDYDHIYGKILKNKRNAAILDVGCGTGVFLKYLDQYGFTNAYGIDISREMIEYCQKSLPGKCEYIESLESFLGQRKNCFDFIFLNDVIEHFPREKVIVHLKTMRDSLKSGGNIVIKTGNSATLAGFYLRFKDFTHFLGFTEYSLRQVLLVSGFKDIELREQKLRFLFRLKRIVRIIGDLIIRNLYRIYYIFHYGDGRPTIFSKLLIAIAKK